jgi:hypothetical protein
VVFNATFNNISIISWRSVLLVAETEGPGEKHRPRARMGLLDNMCFADVQEPCPSLDLMLPVSQECPFLIVSLVYFTYFQFTRRCRKMYISKLSIQKMVPEIHF